MARLFNVEVFNMTIGNGGSYYTGQEFYNLLGSADSMFVQVIMDAATDAAASVTVAFQTTNTAQEESWATNSDPSVTVSITSLSQLPKQDKLDLPGEDGAIGAFGRFKVTGGKPATSVRIVVCGRSH